MLPFLRNLKKYLPLISRPLAGRWIAAMASHMEATSLERFLVHILTPVYRLVEDGTIRDSQMGKCFSILSSLIIDSNTL